ncbi:hypothetical protein [Croceibacterium soli]|uniref:hypothetical protein n=1 Tax=Croceibacterium soli TaxID=1739690 RepID=UPI002E2758C9
MPLLAAGPGDNPRYLVPERRFVAPEARQGVASSGEAIYAIDNSNIGKYAPDGARIAAFAGDPEAFPHLNSCTLAERELVCAASNYPATPHRGTIEFFDPETLAHLRSVALPDNPGSLTALTRRDGRWWAVFAHYDGKGGVPGRDHRATMLAELNAQFRAVRRFAFPQSVLDRISPRSVSGAAWGADGRLYVSGHDKPEVYAMTVPPEGDVLRHEETYAVASFGQAIDFDPHDPALLWSIDRDSRSVIASRIPASGVQR